ncbi:hypothetical protein [Roseiconus nitratireducens]|uniref:hypothetical protein n=1 Tax=Roseiconus nitratireducens TaxID=2605748 RepID=UPI00191C349F|nr:hypothetical protein [Roseiconus nitratireducens]
MSIVRDRIRLRDGILKAPLENTTRSENGWTIVVVDRLADSDGNPVDVGWRKNVRREGEFGIPEVRLDRCLGAGATSDARRRPR